MCTQPPSIGAQIELHSKRLVRRFTRDVPRQQRKAAPAEPNFSFAVREQRQALAQREVSGSKAQIYGNVLRPGLNVERDFLHSARGRLAFSGAGSCAARRRHNRCVRVLPILFLNRPRLQR